MWCNGIQRRAFSGVFRYPGAAGSIVLVAKIKEETSDVKRVRRYLPLLVLPLCLASFASAQSLIDFNVGFGAAQAKASSTGIDQFLLTSCTLGSAGCAKTPALSGFNMGFGVNLMLWKHFGVGMEATLQPGKQTYVELPANPAFGLPASKLQSRVTFYDFNGIYQPINTKAATVQLAAGVGGTNMKFYQNFSSSSLIGNYNQSQYASSSNHFNLHFGAGVQVYVSGNFFVRPEFDLHYVPNFEQFGRNLVTQELVWVGYTIGDRQ